LATTPGCTESKGRVYFLRHIAGRVQLRAVVSFMPEVVSPFPTWLTYQQVAERLGLRSPSAAAARARRGKWPRRIRNDTLEAEVCVPTEVLAAGPRKARERRKPGDAEAGDQTKAVAAAVAPLQAVIETLAGELRAARESNDALRERIANAQAESAQLKGKADALEAALDREVADRRTLQQQVDHVRRERLAAQERVIQAQAEILDERRRLQATEDLVTRLKHELRLVEQASKRRRWWHWR
jgi:chromosome segregation ATPase